MGRSLKKGPYVDEKLLIKIEKLNESGRKDPIKTWARRSTISPDFKVFNFILPILTLINRKVGCPTAAVIFLTCLNLPSFKVMANQLVGPCRSSLIFFERSSKIG